MFAIMRLELEKGGASYNISYKLEDLFDQALQSQAEGFSLEDMRKIYECGTHQENFHENHFKESLDYIQSFTKETPKGEIVIELNEGKLIFR